ncbi:MAG TPA: PepSY-associated TM helix domain-containing protein [Opitutus sp.]|nr:PepSY-associated TM helix domain-containing protein [Opitutus sp.]
MRKRLWQLHSWLGLIAGLGLLVIGLTGSLLVFHDELEALVNPGLIRVQPAPAGRLPLDPLLAGVNRALPDYEVTGWLVRAPAEKRYADILYLIRHGSDQWLLATLDPYTGRILASPRAYTATLTGWLLELHYTFFADRIGEAVAGVFAVMLCTLGVSGLWIYREFWKSVLRLRWRRSARILFSDVHKSVGIVSVAFNLLLGFTGAYWNLTRAVAGEPAQPKMTHRLYAGSLSLDALVADAARRLPGFRTNFLSLPSQPAMGVTLYGAVVPSSPLRSLYGSTVSYDAQTGAHQATFDLRSAGAWAQAVDAFTPLHFGTFGGLPVKILWCLAGLAPGTLAVSGFVIWRLRRRAHSPAVAPAFLRRAEQR